MKLRQRLMLSDSDNQSRNPCTCPEESVQCMTRDADNEMHVAMHFRACRTAVAAVVGAGSKTLRMETEHLVPD